MTANSDDDAGRFSSRTEGGQSRRSRRPLLRQVLVRVGLGLLILVVAGAAGAALLAHQASSVRSQLQQVVELVPKLSYQLEIGEYQDAQWTFNQMQENTSAARDTVTGPLWKVASIVPFVGPNLDAVAELAVSAHDVATLAVAPLLDKYDSLDWQTLSPTDGHIDVSQLKEAAPAVSTATNTVRLSSERLAAIDLSNLLPQVAAPIRSATEQLQEASGALGTVSSVARLLPAMLGADDPRNYLVLVQNSAEVRATGGIPGALTTLKTDGGRISMGEQTSAGALGSFVPSLDVDPQQEALYTGRIGTQMQNVNLTPDFPTAAETAKRMWEQRHPGELVDGVFALDPVVLSHLVKATGPVDLADPAVLALIENTSLPTSLTEENVVATLLSDVYREIEDPKAQDAYFAAVAGLVFSALTDGSGDSDQLISALTTSAQEQRLYLWSSKADEQAIIASTALAGSVLGADGGGAAFGVYFNDGTGAKMDYYASRTVQLLQACPIGGYNNYTVRLTVTNNAPPDAASSLPDYVTGGGIFGVEPGSIRTNHVVYGPAQSLVETAALNGETVPIGAGRHGQRPVGTLTLELGPGETAVLDVKFSRVVQDSEPRLHVTPSIASPEDVIIPFIRESPCQ